MKRILTFALAALLLFALLCSGAGAINDADKVSAGFETAVDALVELGVIQGDQYGNFDPQGTFTREAAAKIVCMLACGMDEANKLTCDKAPFRDVEAKRWSAAYIDWCVKEGYIAGMGDGRFDPTGKITGYGFAKLLICLLGHNAKAEGLVGNDWEANTRRLAEQEGIFKGNEKADMSKPAKREACALYAYNAYLTAQAPETGSIVYIAGGLGQDLGGGQYSYSGLDSKGERVALFSTADALSTGIYRHIRGAIQGAESGASDGVITALEDGTLQISGARYNLKDGVEPVYLRNDKALARGQHVYFAADKNGSLEAIFVVTDQLLYKLKEGFVTEGYTATVRDTVLVGGAGIRNSVEIRVDGDFRGKSAIVAVGDSPMTYTLAPSEQVEKGSVTIMVGFSDVNSDRSYAIVVG